MLVLDSRLLLQSVQGPGVVVHVNSESGCAWGGVLGDFHQPVKAVPLRQDTGADIRGGEWLCCPLVGRGSLLGSASQAAKKSGQQSKSVRIATPNPSAIHA